MRVLHEFLKLIENSKFPLLFFIFVSMFKKCLVFDADFCILFDYFSELHKNSFFKNKKKSQLLSFIYRRLCPVKLCPEVLLCTKQWQEQQPLLKKRNNLYTALYKAWFVCLQWELWPTSSRQWSNHSCQTTKRIGYKIWWNLYPTQSWRLVCV